MTGHDDLHLQAFHALQAHRAAMQSAVAEAGSATAPIPASRMVAYARRADSTADLALERALRERPGLRLLYARVLSGIAVAASPRAAAASDARVTQRRIGEHRLEVVPEADGLSWLVLRLADGAGAVTMLELRGPDGTGRRIALGAPIDGVIQLPLDEAFADLAGVAQLIGNPGTEIYLL